MEKKKFRPLIGEGTKLKPVKQIYKGFEIEKKQILLTLEKDHTKNGNGGLKLYNDTLKNGKRYEQGYLKDGDQAAELVQELGLEIEFAPNTCRLRKIDDKNYILTLKDKKKRKTREVEWEIPKKIFLKYWKYTKGARVYKRRWTTEVKGFKMEFDAFTDRLLLMVETEVDKKKLLKKVPKLGMDVTGNSMWSNKSLSK